MTSSFVVPTIVKRILALPDEVKRGYDVSSMRSLIVGALNVSALYQGFARRQGTAVAPAAATGEPPPTDLHALEKQHILSVLESVGGDKTRAAQLLGISRRTLERRLAEWAQA